MINAITKAKIGRLAREYHDLRQRHPGSIEQIDLAEIPEMVYNSNAIENSTLTLEDTEDILIYNRIRRDADIREIYEAKNLAKVIKLLITKPQQKLTIQLILDLHKTLLTDINDDYAGRFRHGHEWVRVGAHVGANPDFVGKLMSDLVDQYNDKITNGDYFLTAIAQFHAEMENIHPFCDGNGRTGRVILNQQLVNLGYPPVIIRSKNKREDYYPLFDKYLHTDSADGFVDLFALLLIESLHKRIALLNGSKIISLQNWCLINNININSANNKARRQSIPAFRQGKKWFIASSFNGK